MAQAAKALRHFSGRNLERPKRTDKSVRPTQTKPKSKAAGESPASTQSGAVSSLVFQNEVEHQQDRDKQEDSKGQDQRPVRDWRRWKCSFLGRLGGCWNVDVRYFRSLHLRRWHLWRRRLWHGGHLRCF